MQPEQTQLSNGIPVIIQDYDAPVAAIYWWVQVGSADEQPKQAGFAHFLEHMLFKDTTAKETGAASTGELARAIESLGGDINAYTSFDQTVYHVTCAAQHWEKVFDAFGSMARPQRFLKKDFESEREVILEELRKNQDSPGRQLFQSLFTTTFKKHPYGRPVIGFERTLNAAKVADLEAFYKKGYAPHRMGLVLVGPLADKTGARKKAILKLAEKYFGSKVLKAGAKAPAPERAFEAPLRDRAATEVRTFDVKTPTLAFAFRVPGLLHEDIAALDLLSGVLGMGDLSRVYRKLFYDESLVTHVSGSLYVPRDPGMLFFQAEVESLDKIEPAGRALISELKRITEEGPTPEELARVLVHAESERLYSTQTADGVASRLGFMKFTLGDLEYDRRYLDELRAVDSSKVQEVAKRYLDYKRMSIVAMVPEKDASYSLASLEKFARETLPGEPVAPKSARSGKVKPAPEYDLFELGSGMKVVYRPRPQSHVFSVYATALGGVRLEVGSPLENAEKDWGTSYFLAQTWTKGTSRKSAQEVAAITEGLASGLNGTSGRNAIGLQMTGLARDFAKLSDLFTEVLLEPSFPEDEVVRMKRVIEDSIRTIDDHSSELCSKLFLETLFEKHPYGKIVRGSLDSVAGIDPIKLKRYHQAWIRPERLVVSLSGAVNRTALDRWLGQLEKIAAERAKNFPALPSPRRLDDEPALKAPRWVEKALGREQMHIMYGGLGSKIDAPDFHVLKILQTLLGGQSGRLFIELREKRSLAYTTSPISFEGLERGYVGTYIACSPSKREEAIAGTRTVLETLARKGPTPAEMKRAQEYFLGNRAMDLQSDSALAADYGLKALYGVPLLNADEAAKRIKAVTAQQVKKACEEYFIKPHFVTAVVG